MEKDRENRGSKEKDGKGEVEQGGVRGGMEREIKSIH